MWTKSECNTVKLFPTWDWDCNTFFDNYAEYSLYAASAGAGPAPTSQAAHGPAPPVADDPKDNVVVTPGGPAQPQIVPDSGVTEEKVEFRDENGNLLDDAQVRELEGRVSFSTRYETRTRLVDQLGNEVHNAVVEADDGQAGTRAEGVDPETPAGDEKEEASPRPPKQADVGGDLEKERSVEASRDEASPGHEPLKPSDEGHVEL